MAFPYGAGAISGAVAAVVDCPVHLVGNVLPVELGSHGVVNATCAWVSRQLRVTREVKEAWTKGAWSPSLNCAIERGSVNEDPIVAIGVKRDQHLDSGCNLPAKRVSGLFL